MAAWRYWRFLISAVNGAPGTDAREAAFRIAGVDQTDPSGAVTAATSSSFYSGQQARYAFDDLTATPFATDFGGSWPQWLQYDFGAGNDKAIDEFIWQPTFNGSARYPKDFKIQASADGVDWVDAASYTNVTSGWTAGVDRSFTFTSPDPPAPPPQQISQSAVLVLSEGAVISRRIAQSAVLILAGPILDSITNVDPGSGPTAGGTPVTITGVGFTGATDVTFDGTSVTSFTVVSDTEITTTSPAHASGLVDVVVVRPTTNLTAPNAFTYTSTPIPTIISISPDHGSVGGGTSVTITGTGLVDITSVTFNGIAASSVVEVSDTELTCIVPASAITGLVDVEVINIAGSDTLVDGYEYIALPRITQLPILTLSIPKQPSRVTQTPLLVVSLPEQDAHITQLPTLVVYDVTPIPPPIPLLPEVPVIEIWQYSTVVTSSERNKEQRSSLRKDPRVKLQHTALVLNDEDYRKTYELVTYFLSRKFIYPSYVHSAIITAAANSGTDALEFDPVSTDLRVGEMLSLYDPVSETTYFYEVESLDAGGCVLTTNLEVNVQPGWTVAPALMFTTRTPKNIEMEAVSGSIGLDLISYNVRSVLRPDQATNLLTMLDGLVVLTKRPLANETNDNTFDQNMVWLDNGIGPAEPRTSWRFPHFSGKRAFLARRPIDLDYWRQFANTVKGRWKSFLTPTFREDLSLIVQPALSATQIQVNEIRFFELWRSRGWQYLCIQSKAGTIYLRINEVIPNYNLDGDPVSLTVKLNAPIGAAAGSNEDMVISFMNRVRLDDDEIQFEHSYVDSVVSFSIRLVEE